MELSKKSNQLLLDYEKIMDDKYHFKDTILKMRDWNAGNRTRHSNNDVKQ